MFTGDSARLVKQHSLLEGKLCTLMLWDQCVQENLSGEDGKRAAEIMRGINRQALGAC
jgi:hypothetical protein